MDLHTNPETLRSAGARFVLITGFYKHLAPLEPGRSLAIFVPGLLVMSPVHNVIPALIVTVVVDAIVYCAVAYFILSSVLRIIQGRQHPLRKTDN